MECVKKCALKKFSWEPAGTGSCVAQGGVLIFQSTPEGLSVIAFQTKCGGGGFSSFSLSLPTSLYSLERKGAAAQRAGSSFVGNEGGRKKNLSHFLPGQ